MSWQKMTSIALTFTEDVQRDVRNDLKKVLLQFTICCLWLYYSGAEFGGSPLNQAKSDSCSLQ